MLSKYLAFSFFRFYIFLFFTAAQSFLVFWIGVTLFLFPPFALFGLFMYLFVLLIQKVIQTRAGQMTPENIQKPNTAPDPVLPIFFLVMIIFVVAYMLVVYWMQNLVIAHFGVPAKLFSYVSWALNAFSFILSFYFSFVTRK